jgi:hypothetical protein
VVTAEQIRWLVQVAAEGIELATAD